MDATQLDALLKQGETKNIEFKGSIGFEGDFRPHFAATIASMANTADGGTVLVGVERREGVHLPIGLSPEQLESFDPTRITQYLRGRLSPLPVFTTETVRLSTATCLAIQVRAFEDVPIIVSSTLQGANKLHAREGDILTRTSAAETARISNADDMRELLGRAVRRKGEDLLSDLQAILTGAPPRRQASSEELFTKELPGWQKVLDDYETEFSAYAHWVCWVLPLPLSAPLPPMQTGEALQTSVVRLRGWNFPAIPKEGLTYRAGYVEGRVDWDVFRERLAASYSGAFGHASLIWSELQPQAPTFNYPPPPARPLDFVDMTWTLTERLRFVTSFLEALGAEGAWVAIELRGIGDRYLASFTPRRRLGEARKSSESIIRLEGTFSVPDLRASWKDVARQWVRTVYTVFQAPDVSDEIIQRDQDDLLERRW